MPEVLTIASNPTVAKIINASEAVKNQVTQLLSYLVEGHEHMTAFTRGGWNGRSSFFSQRTSTFPAGFVHLVHGELVRAGHTVRLVKHPNPAPLGVENPIVDEFGNDDPRYDFQLKALRQVEKHGRGIIQVATGGGKSKIAKLIVSRYRRPTLFLTTRGVLMYQMKRSFVKDCGFTVGTIGDGHFAPTRGINVGMVQTFVAQLKEPDLDAETREIIRQVSEKGLSIDKAAARKQAQPVFEAKVKQRNRMIKLLSMFEVVIGEEAHEAGGDSYYEILKHCSNAHIRVALTATPFMRDDAQDNMRLMAAFGPILIKVSEKILIERGILAKPYFMFRSPQPHPKLRKTSPWQRAYELGITTGPYRNADIIGMAKLANSYGLSVLILVQRKKHGPFLLDLLRDAGLKAKQIQGENDQDERERALGQLERGALDVLIGTTIVDVGVDVPSIGMVILAGGGKAEVAHRQRIGRGLRAKKTGPNVAFIVDFTDELNSHLRDHARQRRNIIEQTPGFAEGILKPGQDFPWHLFQKKKAA
jgi:superfamily II DNA or RNA helicase